MNSCRLCNKALNNVLSLGTQPVCNRFLVAVDSEEQTFPFTFASCENCGVSQLAETAPVSAVTPEKALTYREPEGHLDSLVENLCKLPGIDPEAPIWGLSAQDASSVERFKVAGFRNTLVLDPREHLGIENPAAGIESIQAAIASDQIQELSISEAAPRLLIARMIYEHAHDPRAFLAGLASLLDPEGYLVLEVPDSKELLERQDYCFLWEEHTLYFSMETFLHSLILSSFEIVESFEFPNPMAASLVAVLKINPATTQETASLAPNPVPIQFIESFPETKERIRDAVMRLAEKHDGIAFLGAGHLTIKFINFFELGEFVSYVIDENPDKVGRFLPGSRVPVIGDVSAVDSTARCCLLAVSQAAEPKVIEKFGPYFNDGASMASIFSFSDIYFENHLKE